MKNKASICKKSFFLFLCIALLFQTSCSDKKTSLNSKEIASNKETASVKQDQSNYDKIILQAGLEEINESVKEAKATAEYRVVKDASFGGYYYTSLQVFQDGTGSFTYIGETAKLNRTIPITKKETETLLAALKTNDFWNIHPDEKIGFDGSTTYIEGLMHGKTHFIEMWSPDQKDGIYQIQKAFWDFCVEKIISKVD